MTQRSAADWQAILADLSSDDDDGDAEFPPTENPSADYFGLGASTVQQVDASADIPQHDAIPRSDVESWLAEDEDEAPIPASALMHDHPPTGIFAVNSDDEGDGESDAESDDVDVDDDFESTAAFRASIAEHDPLYGHAVEDDAAAVEARLAEAPDWAGLLCDASCHGMAPLHFAALCGSPRAARTLLEAGAPVELRDGAGRTALALAVRSAGMREGRTDDDGVQQATMIEIASDLIACGASWAAALDGEPPLDTAERDELRAWVARDDADGAAWRRVLAADGGGGGDGDDRAAADAAAEVARRVGALCDAQLGRLAAQALEDALGARERRWAALEGTAAAAAARAVEGAATRALTPLELGLLERPSGQPPAASRARLWALVRALGAMRLEKVLAAERGAAALLLRRLAAVAPPVAERLETEAALAQLRAAAIGASAADGADAASRRALVAPLRRLVAPPARCRLINVCDCLGRFALHAAAAAGGAHAILTLLEGRANPNIRPRADGAKGTALQAAVRGGHADAAAALIAARADPSLAAGGDAEPPLVHALRGGDGSLRLVQLLLDAGADARPARDAAAAAPAGDAAAALVREAAALAPPLEGDEVCAVCDEGDEGRAPAEQAFVAANPFLAAAAERAAAEAAVALPPAATPAAAADGDSRAAAPAAAEAGGEDAAAEVAALHERIAAGFARLLVVQ